MQGRMLGAWQDIATNTLMRICVDDKVHLVLIKERGTQEYRLSTAEPLKACDGGCKKSRELPADAEEAVRQFLATHPTVVASVSS